MSLRQKIMVSIAITMIIVLSLLSLNFGVTAWSHAKVERERIGNLVRKVVQDWIAADKTLQEGPPTTETWIDLTRKLSGSLLFRDWVVVDATGKVLANDPNLDVQIYNRLAQDLDLKSALDDQRIHTKGDRVCFPLMLPADVGMLAMSCDVGSLVDPESLVWESIKNILGIMVLGTILVVLNIFMLLRRLLGETIDQLMEASFRIAQGDYTRAIPTDGSGTDEISQLVESFNTMMLGLREYHQTLEAKISEAREQIKQTQQGLVIAQRLSATGTLAAGVAHEINNPLGGLINATRTLRKPDLDPAKRDQYLELIGEGLDRIQETVRKLLQFTPRKTEPQPVQLTQVMHRAIALVLHRLDKRAIALDDRLPPELPLIFGDASELQQVFVNLIINAVDAIEDATGVITVAHEIRELQLVIVIEDTGCGMTDDEVSKAFDLFFTTKPVGQGTGLGLAVVSNIVANHGGTIEMTSRKTIGTKVFVILPILAPVPPAPAADASVPAAPVPARA